MTSIEPPPKCPDCKGETVEFRGNGSDMEFKVCARYAEPGHLNKQQINEEIARRRNYERPKGRFA